MLKLLRAVLKKEQKCPVYLGKKRKEHEIRWMLIRLKKKLEKSTKMRSEDEFFGKERPF